MDLFQQLPAHVWPDGAAILDKTQSNGAKKAHTSWPHTLSPPLVFFFSSGIYDPTPECCSSSKVRGVWTNPWDAGKSSHQGTGVPQCSSCVRCRGPNLYSTKLFYRLRPQDGYAIGKGFNRSNHNLSLFLTTQLTKMSWGSITLFKYTQQSKTTTRTALCTSFLQLSSWP